MWAGLMWASPWFASHFPPPRAPFSLVKTSDTFFFFRVQPSPRKKLQLVGIRHCSWLPSMRKCFPNIEDFVYITDNAYTSSQIREMETLILKELKFELGRLPLHFLRRDTKEVSASSSLGDFILLFVVSSQKWSSERKAYELIGSIS